MVQSYNVRLQEGIRLSHRRQGSLVCRSRGTSGPTWLPNLVTKCFHSHSNLTMQVQTNFFHGALFPCCISVSGQDPPPPPLDQILDPSWGLIHTRHKSLHSSLTNGRTRAPTETSPFFPRLLSSSFRNISLCSSFCVQLHQGEKNEACQNLKISSVYVTKHFAEF